jgi:predicted dehydrogenase
MSESNELTAIASRDFATAKAWAGEFGIPRPAKSYEEVLTMSDIDVIYIPLPNELHRPWVLAAANAGKHILCEKPLALNADEARQMVDHCRARGVLLMEAFMWRHQPRSCELFSMVRANEIGELRFLRSSFSFSIAPGDWRLNSAQGGGALLDVGCYGINMARYYTQSEPLGAKTFVRTGPTSVDLSLATILTFPGEVLASIDCSFEQPYRCEFEIVGQGGSIKVPDAYLPTHEPNAEFRWLGDDASAPPAETRLFSGQNQYAAMIDAFAASIEAGKLIPPCEDGLAQMKALDLIRGASFG